MSERIEAIRKDVEEHAGCSATHLDSTPVTEGYLDQIIWEGVVETFELHAHPKAQRAYGWRFWEGKNAQYTVVLGIPRLILQILLSGLRLRQKHKKCRTTRSDDRRWTLFWLLKLGHYPILQPCDLDSR